jgi:hypothetical protein
MTPPITLVTKSGICPAVNDVNPVLTGKEGPEPGDVSQLWRMVPFSSSTIPSLMNQTKFVHAFSGLPFLIASRVRSDCDRIRSIFLMFELLKRVAPKFPSKTSAPAQAAIAKGVHRARLDLEFSVSFAINSPVSPAGCELVRTQLPHVISLPILRSRRAPL